MKKMMIVEDSSTDAELLRALFEPKGFAVKICVDGESALAEVGSFEPDIILLDTLLPGTDGFSVCEQIKKMTDVAAKIVIMTGKADAIDATLARRMGADDYAVKTTDGAELLRAVNELM